MRRTLALIGFRPAVAPAARDQYRRIYELFEETLK